MRAIPDPGFAGDDGSVDPALAAALARGADRVALAAFQHTRVLVPVVAVLGELEYDEQGLAHDKASEMAAVLMTGRDGRLALLAFTGTEPMRAWDPQARPVPVTAQQAALSAVQDGAEALLVDVAGPVLFVIEDDDLRALAEGYTLTRLVAGRWDWVAVG